VLGAERRNNGRAASNASAISITKRIAYSAMLPPAPGLPLLRGSSHATLCRGFTSRMGAACHSTSAEAPQLIFERRLLSRLHRYR